MIRWLLAIGAALVFMACSSNSDSDGVDLYPVSAAGAYRLIPNDSAANDSAAAWLSQGVFTRVQPGGTYTLSFDTVSGVDAPILHIFRVVVLSSTTWKPVWIKTINPTIENGRVEYEFECNANAPINWSLVLEQNDTYYSGPVNNIHFAGEGAYDSTLTVNLIVAGEFGGFSDSVTIDSAAHALLLGYRNMLESAGVTVDTVIVHKASEHPTQGDNYPDDVAIEADYDNYGISTDSLGGWDADGLYYALDVVLVNRFAEDGILGLSPLYGTTLGGGTGSTVATATHYTSGSTVYQTSSAEWVATAMHESSHFFGLRHTTSTTDDIESTGDASITEDGLTDTPACTTSLTGNTRARTILGRYKAFASTSIYARCPDASYLMFPIALDGVTQTTFSNSEAEIWKKNLELFPH